MPPPDYLIVSRWAWCRVPAADGDVLWHLRPYLPRLDRWGGLEATVMRQPGRGTTGWRGDGHVFWTVPASLHRGRCPTPGLAREAVREVLRAEGRGPFAGWWVEDREDA